MMKTYLQERSHRLHVEILDNLDDPVAVQRKAAELLELLEENSQRDYPNLLKSIGRKPLQEALFSGRPLKELNPHLECLSLDAGLLFQIFTLLGDEARRVKAESLSRKEYENSLCYYRYLLEDIPPEKKFSLPIVQLRLSVEYYRPMLRADIKTHCTVQLNHYLESEEGGYKQTVYARKALYDYCFLTPKEYDDSLDKEIVHIFQAHLSCNRNPRDLFHTDHTYIKDHLAKNPSTGSVKDPAHWSAERFLESIRLRYILREAYPKTSFGGEDERNYKIQRILFDRVLFNKVALNTNDTSSPHYWEPEMLLGIYLEGTIPHRALLKSEWIGLYLASKEIELDLFQDLFRSIPQKEKAYKQSALGAFYALSMGSISINEELRGAFTKGLSDVAKSLDEAPPSLSAAQKKLFQGLLFICMWEKAAYCPISQKALEELSKGEDAEETIKQMHDYFDKTKLHGLFTESPAENLSTVLKEASKLLKMSAEGFDYSFFELKEVAGGADDFITLLYHFSRIERESKPALISVLNLLRKRQLEYLPLIINRKVSKENKKALEALDTGFSLPYFQATLFPLVEIPLLKNSDLDNRYLYVKKTVKFVCESDRAYMGVNKTNVDWLLSNRKALHSVYLYKIRNQASHFAEDENISKLTEPQELRQLLLILIEAFRFYKKYADDIYFDWEREGLLKRMISDHPYRLIAPLYIHGHLGLLIKTLCFIAGEKGLSQLAPSALEEDFTNLENYLRDNTPELESYELDKENTKDAYELDEEKIKNIMAKLALTEGFVGASFRSGFFDLAKHSLTYFKEILRDTLRFLFSSDMHNYDERTQENSFFKTCHAESAFYMLYLAPTFFHCPDNNPK